MKRKSAPKKTKRFSSIKEETAHYNAILIEDLKDQFQLVVEKVEGVGDSLKTQMDEDKTELKREISDTRNALALRMDTIEVELRREITRTRNDLSVTEKRLSEKIDRIGDVIIRHDEEIASLKKATG